MRQLSVERLGWLATLLAPVFLVACGGGGSGGSFGGVEPATRPIEGTFVDAPAEGIEYLTFNGDLGMPHLSGITDQDGTYEYENGESIIFSIGAVVLGATRAQAVITPADLVPTNSSTDRPAREAHLLNLIRLLQTLDVDGDPNNGISIPPLARDIAPLSEVVFSSSTVDFESNLDLQTYLGLVTQPTGSVLIDAVTATDHFEASIAALVEDGYVDPRLSW